MADSGDCIIKSLIAREILDSRGNPTVEAKVYTNSGIAATASTPSGASTGSMKLWNLGIFIIINGFWVKE